MTTQNMPTLSAEKFNHKKEWSSHTDVTPDSNDFNSKFLKEFITSKVNSSDPSSTKYFRVKYEDKLFEKDLISLTPDVSGSSNEENDGL
jgi:hypothetical protein